MWQHRRMDKPAYLAALRRDGDAFATACAAAGPEAPVPTCPGWTVADLTWHLAEVLHFWAGIVADQRDTWEGYVEPERPAHAQALMEFYRDRLEHTLAVLAAADPAQPNWTWAADHTAGFVILRMAQETAVHLADAQLAAGLPPTVEPALASDGIDEFLEHFLEGQAGAAPIGGSVHIHCTDVAGEWTVRETDDGAFAVTREHAKGDSAIRGAAADILLALWRRAPLSTCDVVGDAEVAARFVAASRLE